MARDNPVLDDDSAGLDGPERYRTDGNTSLIDRRSYLKLAGTATATAGAVVAGSTGAVASDDYEVIEADNSIYWLDDGETFENKIIDFSNGNYFSLLAHEVSDWEIRNVAFVGQHAHDQHTIIVRNDGGPGLVENVYMAEGSIRPDQYSSHGQSGIFVHRDHEGHVTIRNCNIQDWPNNGIYANPPYYEDGGTVRIESCLSANNSVSNFRIGSSGSEIVDSVAYNDSNGQYDGRCLWAWGADVSVDDCSFDEGSYPDAIHVRDSTTITMSDTEYTGMRLNDGGSRGTFNDNGSNTQTSSPDLTPPDGVPMTPEEAATGGSGGGDVQLIQRSEDPWTEEYSVEHIYEVENTGDEPVEYYLQNSGDGFDAIEYDGAVIDAHQMWSGDDKAAGRVEPGDTHCWGFGHRMVDVTIEPESTTDARVDGEASSLDWYPQNGADGDDWKDLDELLDGAVDEFEYEVEADEDGVEYYLEAKDGTDFTPFEKSEYVYVSDDGTRAAGLLDAGERHGFTGHDIDPPSMLDVTIRGDGVGYIDGDESALGWYPQDGASGDDWKDIADLLDLDDEAGDENDDDDGGDESVDEWWEDLFGDDEWWKDEDGNGAWLEDFLRTVEDRWTN